MIIKLKNIIFKVIYILLIIYLLIFLPIIFGKKPLVIVSGSMEPKLKVGGILYYEKINVEDFDEGDVLVFKTKDHIISHRLVNKNDNGFVTKGDMNNSFDNELIQSNQILGRGTDWCIPYIGYYADFLCSHKYILYILFGITIIDICNDAYVDYKRRIRNEK